MKETRFKYIDRGKREPVVLIPGWATDYRIFDSLNLDFNYLLPVDFYPDTFEKGLSDALKEHGLGKISLFGWSLGGFLAASFAVNRPELVDELILVGLRRNYPKQGLDIVREQLKKSKKAYLYKFYNQCWAQKKQRQKFRNTLFKDYVESFSLDCLLGGLDYLEVAYIDLVGLNKVSKIKIIHGEHDEIAPIEEAYAIKSKLPKAELITLKKQGHIPFYNYICSAKQ